MRNSVSVASVCLAAALALSSALGAQTAPCKSFEIENVPWVSSAAVVPNAGATQVPNLVLINALAPAEPADQRTITFEIEGDILRKAEAPFAPLSLEQGGASRSLTAIVRRPKGGFFLETGFSRIETFQGPGAVAGTPIKMYPDPGQNYGELVLLSLYSSWTVSADDSLVGFGGIHEPGKDRPTLGFIRASKSRGSDLLDIVRLLQPSTAHSYYLLGHPYFATSSAGTFYLDFSDDQIRLRKVKAAGRPSVMKNLLPADVESAPLPPIPAPTGRASTKGIFETVEKSKMPVGLYALPGERWLYLLTREVRESQTLWLVYRLDPIEGKHSDPLQLPNSGTPAHHITFVPSDGDSFFVVERGAVQENQAQENKVLLKIPSRFFSEPSTSPLRWKRKDGAGLPPVICQPS